MEPGEPRRVLERAPGERYAGTPPAATRPGSGHAGGTSTSPIVRGLAVALLGAGIITVLGGPLSVTAGLVVGAAFIGWLVASIVRPAAWLAVGLSVGSVALGLIGVWLYAGLEGGSLGPLDYLAQVQGWLAPIQLAIAGLVALATIR
jgi:hypothetical protein